MMPGRLDSHAAGEVLNFHRYVKSIRRSVYEAEAAAKRGRSLGIRRALRVIAIFFARRLRFARPLLPPVAALWRRLRHLARLLWTATFGRLAGALLATLFAHRHIVRRFAKRFVPPNSGLSSFSIGLGLMDISHRLIERRIPIMSGLARRLVQVSLTTMLSVQMAAGHIGNTLLLARLINLAFRPYIRRRQMPLSFLYFHALFHSRQYRRIIAEVSTEEVINNHYLNHILGVAYLYSNKADRACYYLKRAISLNDQHPLDHRMLGRAFLLLGSEVEAARCFRAGVELAPNTVMAHQNYAGRYDIPNYKPKDWEMREAERLLIYDNYGQLAEEFFLLGRFEESFKLYQKLLDYQERLRAPPPPDLVARLAALNPAFDPLKPVRLLPYEWVTQFGHIGLLDSYIKMARLGMYPDANYVLLAPEEKVSNRDYLAYWDEHFTIVRDRNLVDELFPYQRMIGDNFMAYPGEAGAAEPWTRAAARAHIVWARQRRAPLLKVSAQDMALGANTLTALGVPENTWYVGLHVREGGYYGESSGGMSIHRNARIEDYLPAIKAVTDRGGYVIRLGDSSMRPLPRMERVIDYAMSAEKSLAADIFFCGTSRFVIGTTSGLTTACLTFGTPMVLVNCISNDWQLWSADTDFIVKPVWDLRNKRHLSFEEVYAQPVQGYLINAQVMRRHGLESVPNTPEEIAEAVRYKLDLMDGVITLPDDETEPLRSYRTAMAGNPMMFGAARPVVPFLERHWNLVVPPDDGAARAEPPPYLAQAAGARGRITA